MGIKVIKCTDRDGSCDVLRQLNHEDGVHWLDGSEVNPIELYWDSYPVWVIIDTETKRITWTYEFDQVPFDAEILTDEQFLYSVKDDPVNHPSHYTSGKVECIDAMEEVFGTEAVKAFCLCNAFKYLFRRKDKENEEQDTAKALWYFDRFKELLNK